MPVSIALLSTACGTATPVKKVEPEPPVVVVPPACIPHDSEYFLRPTLTGNVLDFCTDNAGEQAECWRFDLASDTLTRAAFIPELPEEIVSDKESGPHWQLDRGTNTLAVCVDPSACKPVKLPAKHVIRAGTSPSASADGTMVVATLSSGGEADVPWAAVYDVKSGKQIAKKKIGEGSYTCGGASFIGNTVLVATDVCAGPGGQAWLARPSDLKKIAGVGDEGFNQYAPDFRPLASDDRYVFLETGGRSLLVQDVKTGKVLSKVALKDQFTSFGEGEDLSWNVPATGGFLWRQTDGTWVTGLEGTAMKVVVIDAEARNKVGVHTVPRCAAPPEQ